MGLGALLSADQIGNRNSNLHLRSSTSRTVKNRDNPQEMRRASATDDYFWDPSYPEASILNDVAFGLYFVSIFIYLIFVLPRVFTRRLENRPKTRTEIAVGILTSVLFIVASILSIASICVNGDVGIGWVAVPIIIIILCIFPLTCSSIEYHDYDENIKAIAEEEVLILRREDVVVVGPVHKD